MSCAAVLEVLVTINAVALLTLAFDALHRAAYELPFRRRLWNRLVPAEALRWGRLTGICTCPPRRLFGAHAVRCAYAWETNRR